MGLITFDKCPFCGVEPDNYVSVVRGITQDSIKITVKCGICGIEMSELVQSVSPYASVEKAYDNLIDKWNKRANGKECQGNIGE